MIKRLGLVGDIHCEDTRLEHALDTIERETVCRVAHVGDIVDGTGSADRCISILKQHQIVGVSGNHERWFLAGSSRDLPGATQDVSDGSRSYLEELPSTRRLSTPQGGIMLCHGIGEDDMVVLKSDYKGYALQTVMDSLRPLMLDESLRWLLCGHTHERMVRSFTGLTIINAGTLSDSGPPGFLILDFEALIVETWDFSGSQPKRSADLPLR